MEILDKILKRIEEIIAVSALLGAFILAFLAVVLRNTTGDVIFWSEEAIIYLIIYSTFFGAVIALRDNEHVNVDILPVLLKGVARRTVVLIGAFITIAFAAVLSILAWLLIFEPFSRETQTPALKLPLWVLELSLSVAMSLFLIRAIQQFVSIWRTPADELLVDPVSESEAEELVESAQSKLHVLNQEPAVRPEEGGRK